ncbi:MAG: TIM barrel protein [Candidatus Micrarchaeia archaeon]
MQKLPPPPSALLFGTAGIPLSTQPHDTLHGIAQVAKLGLGAMELEFVRSVNVSKEAAQQVKAAAEQHAVSLTAHGTYFVNLNAKEKDKLKAGVAKILLGAERLWECGGRSIAFHPAYYMGDAPEVAYKNVKKQVEAMVSELRHKGVPVQLRLETTGRPSQFGTLEEICGLCQEVEGVLPCIDWAHLHARRGKNNSFEEFRAILSKLEKSLGKSILHDLHCHVEGITYSAKGELKHVNLPQSDFRFKELLAALKEFKCAGIVISESPNIEGDALLMKKAFEAT